MATIKDVARLAGTSAATISRFMNNSSYVKKSTAERIEKAIKELNYAPHPKSNFDSTHNTKTEPSLNKKTKRKTNVIALVIPDIRNPFFSELLHIIDEIAHKAQYNIICFNSNNNILKISKGFTELKNKVDGIIMAGEVNDQHIEELLEYDIPLIIIDANIEDSSVHSISTNNRLGGKLATLHLIEQGYQRVAHIRGPLEINTAADRYQGYLEALDEKGIPYDPVLIQIGDYQVESGYEAMLRFLALSNPPDAVFISNDLMALGALNAINQSALSVPNEIGIIGYDNIPLTNVITPKLSTIQQPVHEIGKKAIQCLLSIIENSGNEIFHETLEPSLVIRDTSQLKKGGSNAE